MKHPPLQLTFCVLMFLAAGFAPVRAQETMLKAERIKSSDLPPEVLAAYKKRFPSANLKQIVKLPLQVYKNDWEIDELHQPDGSEEFYTLSMTGDRVDLEALYDRKGNLIRANEVARNVALPLEVNQYLVENYKGYTVKKDKVKRLIEPNKISAEWEVLIANKTDKKRVFFDTAGKFIKEK